MFKVVLAYLMTGLVRTSDLPDAALEDNSTTLYDPSPSPSTTIAILPRGYNKVRVNVGGTLYYTTLTTLRSRPESKLSKMFQGRETMAGIRTPKEDIHFPGDYFIDRYTRKIDSNLRKLWQPCFF
jgi:hypothetical protein